MNSQSGTLDPVCRTITEEQAQILSTRIEDLASCLDNLQARLSPVLTPASSATGEDCGKASVPVALSPLADDLRSKSLRVDYLINQVQGMTNRLEV